MNSTEVRLKQFKPAIKGLWKVWHEPLYSSFYKHLAKYMKLIATEEATGKNSRNFRKVSVFPFKKASIQSKNGCCYANFWVDGPKEIGAKVAGKVFFNSWGYG